MRLEYGKLHSGVTIFACKTATNFIQETSAAPSQPLPPPSTPLPSPLSAPGLGRTKRLKQCSRTKRRKRRRHLSSFARVGEQETRGEARGQFPVECGRSWARRISSFVDLPRSAQTFSTNLSSTLAMFEYLLQTRLRPQRAHLFPAYIPSFRGSHPLQE